MPPSKDLHKIIEGQHQDVERGIVSPAGIAADPEAHAGELLAGRRLHRARAWLSAGLDTWTPRLKRIGEWLKAISLVLAGAAGIAGIVRSWRARVTPAELPATGQPTIGTDFVPRPKPPLPEK
jgi:hypothetical protein